MPEELAVIPYLPHDQIDDLLQRARSSSASLQEPALIELVRDQVRQFRDVQARQKRLEKLLVAAYHALPTPNHLHTIPGTGDVTAAAVLTAFILDIQCFETPNKLVAYFGIMPSEASSGIDRDGKPRGPKHYVLKKQLSLWRVLDQLGKASRLRGRGPQRRCACPLHRGDARGRTFSVNLDDNVFHCFDAACARKGDVIDLWAAVQHLTLRDAALDLIRTFDLEPASQNGTEKRQG